MLSSLRSGNCVMKWTKEVTNTRLVSGSSQCYFQEQETGDRRQFEGNPREAVFSSGPIVKSLYIPWQRIKLRPRLPQLRQQQQRMQNRTDNIRRNTRLIILHHGKIKRHDPRILNQDIEPLQPLRTFRKALDGLIVREIELPDFDDARSSRRLLNGFLGRLALFEVADGEDDFGGVEADKVAGGFETEAGVAAGDDDGLVGVFFCGVGGYGEELGAHECDGGLHVRHLGGRGLSLDNLSIGL